jgi:hypothetical protein
MEFFKLIVYTLQLEGSEDLWNKTKQLFKQKETGGRNGNVEPGKLPPAIDSMQEKGKNK